VALILVALLWVFPGASGLADELSLRDQTAALQNQLGRLEARSDAQDADDALEHARRALRAASGPIDDADAVVRAHGIARAAMALAERQLEQRRAQSELIAAQRRLDGVRERANAQRRALEMLMRERAALARRGELR